MIGSIFLLLFSAFSFGSPELSHAPALYIGGDVMISRSVGAYFKSQGFEPLKKGFHPFSRATKEDIILLNLESPFSLPDRDQHKATFIFGSNPRNREFLTWIRGDSSLVVSLANNHIMNRGFSGLRKTIEVLEAEGIRHVGLSQGKHQKYIHFQKGGIDYCIGAYTYDGRSYWDKKSQTMWYVNKLSESLDDIKVMQKSQCDQKIIMLHWGREYRFHPTQSQKKLAHDLIDHGATLIVGGHSHILGEAEKYKGKWIFYSLGNMIFDQFWGAKGCQTNMDCVADPKTGKQVVPTHIGTAVHLDFPYTVYQQWQWYIRKARFEAMEK